jgi:hypothetical protein
MHLCDEVTTHITDKGSPVDTPPQLLKITLETIYPPPSTFVKKKFGENWDGQGAWYTPGKDKMYNLKLVPEDEESV